MQDYVRPAFRAVEGQAEECGCCEYYTYSGETVYVYPGSGSNQNTGTVASGSSGNASATPVCGSGIPGTQANTVGAPAGATGYQFRVGTEGPTYAGGDGQALGVTLLGQSVQSGVHSKTFVCVGC